MQPTTPMRTDPRPSVWRARATMAGLSVTPIQAITAGKRYQVPCDLALFGHMFGAMNTGQPRRRRM